MEEKENIINEIELKRFQLEFKIYELKLSKDNVFGKASSSEESKILEQLLEVIKRMQNKANCQLEDEGYEQAVGIQYRMLQLIASFAMDRKMFDIAEKIYQKIDDGYNVLAICEKN